jgi:VanZ family protein
MRTMAAALPWFLPGLVLSVVVAVLIGPALARALGTRRAVGYLLVISFGAILAATIPPTAGGFDWDPGGSSRCDLGGSWLAPPSHYLRLTEESLNVLLFIPLGLALGMLPRSRRRTTLIAAAFALPVAIEATQLLVPVLGRGCELGDVANNTLGLMLGLAIGVVAVAVARVAMSRAGARPT